MQLMVLYATMSLAAEVVWLRPADDAAQQSVAQMASARRAALDPIAFRAAASDWGPADEEAYRKLEQALRDVRQYETKLDGELVIMEDLATPLAAITVVRNDADRSALFSALAYQGFAVDRFFGASLAKDERAAPYRVDLDGVFVEAPWMDAVALDPSKEVSPYDIAEAPQRVAYGEVMSTVKGLLAARLVPANVPAGASVVVDGRRAEIGPAGTVALVPGRHLVHVEKDGHVLARWDLRVVAGERRDAPLEFGDGEWDAFVKSLRDGTASAPPAALAPAIAALGGEVWIVDRATSAKVEGWKLTSAAVAPLAMEMATDGAAGGPIAASVAIGVGWLSTGDFYLQDPFDAPHDRSTVNAVSFGASAEGAFARGWLHAGAGIDALFTTGEHHVAFVGDSTTRVRAYPHVSIGTPWVYATAGYALPHHPTFGLRGRLPVAGAFELAAGGWYGLATTKTRDDGTTWEGAPLYAAWSGVGIQL